MCKAYSRVGRVDALTTRSATAEDIDANFIVRDLDLNIFDFGQDGDGRCASMNTTLTLGHRHTLHAVHA